MCFRICDSVDDYPPLTVFSALDMLTTSAPGPSFEPPESMLAMGTMGWLAKLRNLWTAG